MAKTKHATVHLTEPLTPKTLGGLLRALASHLGDGIVEYPAGTDFDILWNPDADRAANAPH